MKKMMKGLVVCFAVLFVAALGIMFYIIYNGGMSYANLGGKMNLENTLTFDMSKVEEVAIKYSSEDVVFYIGDTQELVLKEYMSYKPKERDFSTGYVEDGKVVIEGKKNHFSLFHFGTKSSREEIYLPKSYAGSVTVSTASGNIKSDEVLNLSLFFADTASGDIRMNEIYASSIHAGTASGNINMNLAEGSRDLSTASGNITVLGGAGDTEADTASGNIKLENAQGILELGCASGDIKVMGAAGGGEFETASGNVSLQFDEITASIDAQSTSGNVKLQMPQNTAFTLEAATTSGNINTFFDDQLQYNKKGNKASGALNGASDLLISLETTSGNIKVLDND
ncbi:DUF4097 family beta strand repeat-containing protein [Diplocloster agilis]|uniref:DUF4097 family beta strand repeat-containing protein n=1 Tax=Diplocloster agilis TaxID=2850323 RepID=UPI000820D9D7|nr:DUF4097 domain-containing protein [Suonthocola fibrivorans]MCU6732818.1 DUF4097 domain-containing protein [Suonthocola fibrivorans]SCI64213.1 Uncharacterised protein [uncultured Clostridium sp.]